MQFKGVAIHYDPLTKKHYLSNALVQYEEHSGLTHVLFKRTNPSDIPDLIPVSEVELDHKKSFTTNQKG